MGFVVSQEGPSTFSFGKSQLHTFQGVYIILKKPLYIKKVFRANNNIFSSASLTLLVLQDLDCLNPASATMIPCWVTYTLA
jgi:hypothetical protein